MRAYAHYYNFFLQICLVFFFIGGLNHTLRSFVPADRDTAAAQKILIGGNQRALDASTSASHDARNSSHVGLTVVLTAITVHIHLKRLSR